MSTLAQASNGPVKTRKRKHRPLKGLRRLLFRGSKEKETITFLPAMNKENTFPTNTEEALLQEPEESRPKRVSLLNQQEDVQIKKKAKSKKQPKPRNSAIGAPSLLVTKGSLSTDSNQDDSDPEAKEFLRLRQELQSIRNQLSNNDSPCPSELISRTIEKKTKTGKKKRRNPKTKAARGPLRPKANN